MATRLNITEFIQESGFNAFHLRLAFIGFLLIVFDSYDLAIYGAIVPALMESWKLTPIQTGAIASYSLIGMLFGAITFGMVADRIGRKRVICISVILFSVFTVLCGFASGPTSFSVFRVLAGFGLGGIPVTVIAMLMDFSPLKKRATIATVVLCGYSLGGILAPLVSIPLIPRFGWESVFWVAAIPLFLLPLLFHYTPESTFALIRSGRKAELYKLLAKIDPSRKIDPDSEPYETEKSNTKLPLIELFRSSRGLSTIMFSVAIIFHLILNYGLVSWLPKLMMENGFNMTSGLTFLITLHGGAIVGTLLLGRLADKWGIKNLLMPLYLTGSVTMILLSFNKDPILLYALVAIGGAAVVGAQSLVQVYIAQFYPAQARSTALGAIMGLGRVGAILGPLLGGLLLSLPISTVFLAFAVPGVCSFIAIAMVQNRYSHDRAADGSRKRNADARSPGKQVRPAAH
ncbi:aromatic acid/H+ symport family MFS transporter [Diaphorobacter sp. HDW4A]|uniref:MFS transporter n=1 Tax=Diaphorobacter sp. HDW4A TaxID=2714924 RepID=UPI00140742A9|nr:aromatic acid/H+ symport family MFS transporter [Diaphorobacter sp. HDW4A]QIL79428.1 aromatic acid/H+ symport family MFS transporter [Diaphorobacter sp. HDW4A]